MLGIQSWQHHHHGQDGHHQQKLHLQVKKLEGEKKKVESDYNATNSRIQVDDEDVADGYTNDSDNDNDDVSDVST